MSKDLNKYSSIVAKLTAKIKTTPEEEQPGGEISVTEGEGFVEETVTYTEGEGQYIEGGEQVQYAEGEQVQYVEEQYIEGGNQSQYVEGGQQYAGEDGNAYVDGSTQQVEYIEGGEQYVGQDGTVVGEQVQYVEGGDQTQYNEVPYEQQSSEQPVDQYQDPSQQLPVDQNQNQEQPVDQYQEQPYQEQPYVDPSQEQAYQEPYQEQPPIDQGVFGDLPDPSNLAPPPPAGEVVEFPSDVYGGGESENYGGGGGEEMEHLGEESEVATPYVDQTVDPYPPEQPPVQTDHSYSEVPNVVEIAPVEPPSAPVVEETVRLDTRDEISLAQIPMVICEGFMTKCGSFVKNWKLRYFKLTKDGSLTYFKKKDGKPIKSFNIKGMQFRHCPQQEKKKPNCINIYANKKKFFFYGETDNDYNKWVKGIIRGLSIHLSQEALFPRALPPEEQMPMQEKEFDRIKEMMMRQFEYRKVVDGDVDPAMRKSIYKNAGLEEENRRRMKNITMYNWFLHFDFLKHHDDLVHYNETKNPGLFIFGIFKSFVDAMELIKNNHKDCLKYIAEQCTHRRVVIEFVKSHYEDGGEAPSVEEEVEGEVQKTKAPEPFLMMKLKKGQIVIEFLKFRPNFENPTISMMDISRLFRNDQDIRLDTFLNIKMVAEKNKEDSKLMLKNITKIDFDIHIDYPSLITKIPPNDPNLGKLFEVITTRHVKSLVDGLRLLFNHEQKDFIQKRLAKYVPSKMVTFDFVTDLKPNQELAVRIRDEQLVICCRQNDPKWLGNPEKVLRDEGMYATLFTDFSMELPILLEEDVQKKESEYQKKYGDKLESLSGEKWTFKHDWMEIVGWYDPKKVVDENTGGLTEKDLCTLCSTIYENHIKNLCDGIETMINQDEDGVCKAALLKYCKKRQISFSFVEKQETPGCEQSLVGGEIDEEGVFWITVELDGTKRWVEKSLSVLTNTNTLMEIIGNAESPPLVIQLHQKKALGGINEVKDNFGFMFRDKVVARSTDGPMVIDNEERVENWEVEIEWEKMYRDLKAADVRIRGFGNTIKKYLSLLVQRVKTHVNDEKDVRGKKKERFRQVFHRKKVVLTFVGSEGMQDQEFRYCGIVDQGDGTLTIGVKGWRVNNNEMGSRTNDLAKILKE